MFRGDSGLPASAQNKYPSLRFSNELGKQCCEFLCNVHIKAGSLCFRFLFFPPPQRLTDVQSDTRAVLLIDEVDKTGPAFDAFLLEILSDFRVSPVPFGSRFLAKLHPV